jgi:hypothetical protein
VPLLRPPWRRKPRPPTIAETLKRHERRIEALEVVVRNLTVITAKDRNG